MATSSSRSSRASASSLGRGEGMGHRRSPVPYRVGPMAYSPAEYCGCNRKAPCWTSWSDDNPGRRYYRCHAGLTPGDCGFYKWIDREATPYERQLLCDLRDVVWELRRDNAQSTQVKEMLRRENAGLMQLKEELEKEKAEVLQRLDETEDAMVVMAAKMKQESSCWFSRCIVLVIIVGLLFMVMFKKV